MSTTPEAARAQAEAAAADLERITGGSAVTEVTERAAEAIRALLSVFPEPPTTAEPEAREQSSLDSERLRQIAEWLRMEIGHEETAKRVDLIAARHDALAAGFRRPSPPTDTEVNAVALELWGVSAPYDREKLRAALEAGRQAAARAGGSA
jgi:plasmid stabilization system protein ParE